MCLLFHCTPDEKQVWLYDNKVCLVWFYEYVEKSPRNKHLEISGPGPSILT